MSSSLSPFRWKEFPRDSIFMADKSFTYGASQGLSLSHISSASVEKITKATGRSPGSVFGISSQGDRLIEEGNRQRSIRKG